MTIRFDGRVLCANAGILRDKSFGKMELADFSKVLQVHLVGTFYCCKAVWDGMRERNYGRIVLTTSSSGLCRRPRPGQG
jgi:NAD(P)-dependent dehydrogenase (short-subunit alcohol dehydrogenase family)